MFPVIAPPGTVTSSVVAVEALGATGAAPGKVTVLFAGVGSKPLPTMRIASPVLRRRVSPPVLGASIRRTTGGTGSDVVALPITTSTGSSVARNSARMTGLEGVEMSTTVTKLLRFPATTSRSVSGSTARAIGSVAPIESGVMPFPPLPSVSISARVATSTTLTLSFVRELAT